MAIENLWTLGGKPTSYNPIGLGPSNPANAVGITIGEFVLAFYAYSPTSSIVSVVDSGGLAVNKDITLTTISTKYEVSFNRKSLSGGNLLYFIDKNSANDIVVTNIKLVRKPTPKNTVNGIDSFDSGKWALPSQAVIIDTETLELNATADFQTTQLTIPVLPNTTYTFTGGANSSFYWNLKANGTSSVGISGGSALTFTTASNVTSLAVQCYNGSGIRGVYQFKRPMLVLGSQIIPYERKKGDRMILPQPTKNLYVNEYITMSGVTYTKANNGVDVSGDANVSRYSKTMKIPVKQNTNYTISADVSKLSGPDTCRMAVRKGSDESNIALVDGTGFKSITFNTGTEREIYIFLYASISTASAQSARYANIQLEEGVFATTYRTFFPRTVRKANKVPRKNLIKGFTDNSLIRSANAVVINDNDLQLNATGLYQESSFYAVPVLPNTTYTLSADKVDGDGMFIGVRYLQADRATISGNNAASNQKVFTFTTPTNCYFLTVIFSNRVDGVIVGTFSKVMLNEGLDTIFDKYKNTNRKVQKGIKFNGDSDHITIPDHSLTTINSIEWEVDLEPGRLDKEQMFLGALENAFYMRFLATGNLHASVKADSTQKTVQQSSKTMNVGQRYKVGVRASNGLIELLIDGVQVASTTYTGQFSSYQGIRRIGRWSDGDPRSFKGTIYGVKEWENGVLTKYYDFTKKTDGKTFEDLSGNGSTVTLKGTKVGLKSAIEVPKKNLIKPFTSLDWFTDSASGGGTMNIVDPYEISLVTTAAGAARLIQIPVLLGETYTISFGTMTGLYRVYKNKVTTHSGSIQVTADGNGSTFVVDSSFGGYVTLRLTAATAGTYTFKNFQLERGLKSDFEPYTLGNRNRKR